MYELFVKAKTTEQRAAVLNKKMDSEKYQQILAGFMLSVNLNKLNDGVSKEREIA